MTITVRVAESDDDLEAWRRVRMAILPNERCLSVSEMRAMATAETLHLVAELDGELAGSGLAGRSSFDYAGLHPRVLPAARRRGVGTALLERLAEHALGVGFAEAGTVVEGDGSMAFATHFGFVEVDRQVEQVRTIGAEPWPPVPAGIEVVTIASRPELWAAAYDPFALEAYADMATFRPIVVSREQWERDWLSWPEAMFFALADGEIVGCAGLEFDPDQPDRAEHALTAVARPWRRRGLASLLKRMTLAFAATNGVREVYTWTQIGNADMRALNGRLGYVARGEAITVRGPLPLRRP
ncbi:MAG: GNAT family N-acetyltransferase [Chloroflexota bacterium]